MTSTTTMTATAPEDWTLAVYDPWDAEPSRADYGYLADLDPGECDLRWLGAAVLALSAGFTGTAGCLLLAWMLS